VKDVREREAKLAAGTGYTLPDLAPAVEGVSSRPLAPLDLDAVYYDTSDLRLARWGITVRYRTGDGDGWTVKLPEGDDGPALVRRELTFLGPPDDLPAAVAAMVRAYTRAAPLAPVARLRTRRTGVELVDAEGLRLAEVVDDEVAVYDGERLAGRFRELEVELDPQAGAELLPPLVAALTQAGAGETDQMPKLVRALGARASCPPELVVADLSGRSTVAEVVRQAVTASTLRIIRHDPGVRIGDDPEDVHQARVGARRLRSDLQTFRSVLEPAWVETARSELRWLGAELGAVRDTDVLLERLRRQAESLADRDAAGVAALVRRLAQQREVARESLLDALSSERYVALLDLLVAGARSPTTLPGSEARAAKALPALAAGPWKKLKREVDDLPGDPTDDALHAVRIRAKRCRYAAEAVAPVIGKPARRFATAVAGLQTVLGDHQDAVVAEAWLREAATASSIPKLVAGELIALQRIEAAASRQAWRRAWKQARKKRLRTWLP